MIKNLLGDDDKINEPEPKKHDIWAGEPAIITLFDSESGQSVDAAEKERFVISEAEPESYGETARRSGLAWSAGIVFFASITFMLILGWGADLLLGSSPWGIVGGIIIGSLIGFIQFFRLTSQIFKK